MPEPGSEADEAVRDALEAVEVARRRLRHYVYPSADDSGQANALFEQYESAIRASERAKWDAVKQGYVDAAATIEAEFRHYRERFEPIMEEAVASERAKVEALLEVAEARHVAMHLGTPAECGDQLCAALDAVRAGRAS